MASTGIVCELSAARLKRWVFELENDISRDFRPTLEYDLRIKETHRTRLCGRFIINVCFW